MPTKMRAGLNEKHEPAGLALLHGIASLRPPNQKRSDLFNPFSMFTQAEDAPGFACYVRSSVRRSFPQIFEVLYRDEEHPQKFPARLMRGQTVDSY